MIGCAQAVRQLWHYLEHELEPKRHGEVEAHLAACRQCCGELEFAEELRRFLRDAARPTLPADVEDRLDGLLAELEAEAATTPTTETTT